MIYPSINQLTKGKHSRYSLVIATAKCARAITDEYVKQREIAERYIANNKESEKSFSSMIRKDYKDEKAVKLAVNRLYAGDFVILEEGEAPLPVQTDDETDEYDTDTTEE